MSNDLVSETPYRSDCTAHDLTIGYGGRNVVAGINFHLEAGKSLALVGMNGSGKTTLLKTLAGLLPPVSGKYTIMGTTRQWSPGKIAYLSQFHPSGFILPMRVIDIIKMGRFGSRGLLGRFSKRDHDLIDYAMCKMGIVHLANQPLHALSGGQRQRVYLAQVLASHAAVYLLDEPQAGLDASGKELYQQAFLEELERGACVILSTHDIQEALQCSQTVLLAGRVVAVGIGGEVITQKSLLEAFGIQNSSQIKTSL
jgi:ABC-type Mn2+/Zn2+ transport system ATPase subunit